MVLVPLAVAKPFLAFLHGSFPSDSHGLLLLHRNNTSLLQNFWCLPASQLPREQLSSLIRSLASQRVALKAWQVSASRAEKSTGIEGNDRDTGECTGGGPVLQGLLGLAHSFPEAEGCLQVILPTSGPPRM